MDYHAEDTTDSRLPLATMPRPLLRPDLFDLILDLEMQRELHDRFNHDGVDDLVKAVSAQAVEDKCGPLCGLSGL